MKALIRKSGFTPTKPAQDEIYLQPWLDWIDPETGKELADENYRYALCTNVPDEPDLDGNGNDRRMDLNNYVVEEHTEETESDEGHITRRYWTATYQVIQ